MSEKSIPVSLSISGKEYKIVCAENEQDDLISTAQLLDEKIQEIRDTGKVIGPERIAVMAALNLAHELNLANKQGTHTGAGLADQLARLRKKIESVLDKS